MTVKLSTWYDPHYGIKKVYFVGGCVRDKLLGLTPKDIDFAVEISKFQKNPFKKLIDWLTWSDAIICKIDEKFFTVRAKLPSTHNLVYMADKEYGFKHSPVYDFVLCRVDAPTSDGRRPDFVKPGTLEDDLKRRDFTVNAMAKWPWSDEIIDPHGGKNDLEKGLLRFVGDPLTRIQEDGLRVMRALRFSITKGLQIDWTAGNVLCSNQAAEAVAAQPIERVYEELVPMFRHDYQHSLALIDTMPLLKPAIFRDGLWLKPTLESTQ